MSEVKMEDIVSLCKRRGFIYQGSEIYGGLSGTWDYGPLGVALKRNLMNLWWKMFVDDREEMFGVDAAILMNQKVWQASGHVDTFVDPLVNCLQCGSRYRVDKIIVDKQKYDTNLSEFVESTAWHLKDFPELSKEYTEEHAKKLGMLLGEGRVPAYKTKQELIDYVDSNAELAKTYAGIYPYIFLTGEGVACERCGSNNWSDASLFNMMLTTHVGASAASIEGEQGDFSDMAWGQATLNISKSETDGITFYQKSGKSYLRPETAQGIFTNFKNVVDSFSPNMPFGIAQQGKAFRNEISPRDFVFRSREFEQMEIEYFVHPDKWEESFELWRKLVWDWCEAIGLPRDSVHELEVPENDRAHYSKRTIDYEFDFPIGREELLGLAYRTDFDLKNIERVSGKNVDYRPKDGSEPFVPHVIEPSFGLERAIMAVLTAAYTEDEVNGEKRSYLKLPPHIAPVKVAVSPLLKNKPELVEKARQVYASLKKEFGNVMWDDNGNIGKRYRRQDEIGTPYCVVVDFDTLQDNTVTVRHRDTTQQQRVSIDELILTLRV